MNIFDWIFTKALADVWRCLRAAGDSMPWNVFARIHNPATPRSEASEAYRAWLMAQSSPALDAHLASVGNWIDERQTPGASKACSFHFRLVLAIAAFRQTLKWRRRVWTLLELQGLRWSAEQNRGTDSTSPEDARGLRAAIIARQEARRVLASSSSKTELQRKEGQA